MDQIDRPLIAAGVSFVLITAAWAYSAKVSRVRSNEPPVLPGSVPVLGHALAFGKDSNKLFMEARNWSTDLQPVSLSLLGQRIYVVLNPKDVAAVWKTKTLAFEPIVEWGLKAAFGLSVDGVEKLHLDPDGMGDMYENQHSYFRDALAPGPNLAQAIQAFLDCLVVDVAEFCKQVKAAPGGKVQVGLMSWVRDRLAIPATNAFIGPKLLQHDPDIISRLARWEGDFFTLTMGLPRWLLKAAHDNLDKIHHDFAWIGKDPGMLPWLTRRIDMMAVRGITGKDMGASVFTLWMALQVNAVPTSFWLLYHILADPANEKRIQEEIAPAFDDADNLINMDHLVHNTPFFNSMFWETLRWTSGAVPVRKVEEDTMIGGKLFYAGGMVMIPARTNNTAPQLFGPDADIFVADRFIRDPANLKFVKPFGGGNTLCPGRHFANNEVLLFVATTLRKYDISLLAGQAEPKLLTSGSTVGTYLPDREIQATVQLRH